MVLRYEIKDIEPPRTDHATERQMKAEREKRAAILELKVNVNRQSTWRKVKNRPEYSQLRPKKPSRF